MKLRTLLLSGFLVLSIGCLGGDDDEDNPVGTGGNETPDTTQDSTPVVCDTCGDSIPEGPEIDTTPEVLCEGQVCIAGAIVDTCPLTRPNGTEWRLFSGPAVSVYFRAIDMDTSDTLEPEGFRIYKDPDSPWNKPLAIDDNVKAEELPLVAPLATPYSVTDLAQEYQFQCIHAYGGSNGTTMASCPIITFQGLLDSLGKQDTVTFENADGSFKCRVALIWPEEG